VGDAMKVALIDPSLFTVPYDLKLAEGLRDLGHRATLYGKALAKSEAAAPPFALDQHFYPELVAWGADRWPAKRAQATKGLLHFPAMMRLVRRFKADPPDVIHFQWVPLPAIDQLFIPALRRIAPLVLTAHDSRPFNANPGSALQQLGATRIFRHFDRVIAHTDMACRRLASYGVPSGKIAQIAHGVLHDDHAVVSPPRFGEAPVRFLLFGKLKPYKGADLLIEAVGRLSRQDLDRVAVKIVGKPYMDTAPLVAAAGKLDGRVVFDFRFLTEEEMRGAFEWADVIVFPYREIDVSGVLMAVLRTGRPIIASRIGGFAELLEEGRHALLVPPGDVDALAGAIGRLIREPAMRAEMSREIGKLMAAVPSWSDIAKQTAEVYEAAADVRSRSANPASRFAVSDEAIES
jgi:glycosyltransferase involved in cell wall biosynthesis